MILRSVIVEDEKHSRESLKALLTDFCEGVEVVQMAANVEEAITTIDTCRPDLVFLDIELQTGTGFNVLEGVKDRTFDVIFTTAFDQYAIQAIKFSSLDYLLKPIDIDELQSAVNKAIDKKQNGAASNDQVELLLKNIRTEQPQRRKICLATSDGLEFINVEDIIYCEASGSYTNFHLKGDKLILVSKNLKEYEHMLNPDLFMRVHNSFLINLSEVQKFVKSEGGYILMNTNKQISISQSRRDEFLVRMGKLG
ncbi:MAG: LytR/AlgR family response regulator transcription factor [Bacteroidota bacterium]